MLKTSFLRRGYQSAYVASTENYVPVYFKVNALMKCNNLVVPQHISSAIFDSILDCCYRRRIPPLHRASFSTFNQTYFIQMQKISMQLLVDPFWLFQWPAYSAVQDKVDWFRKFEMSRSKHC